MYRNYKEGLCIILWSCRVIRKVIHLFINGKYSTRRFTFLVSCVFKMNYYLHLTIFHKSESIAVASPYCLLRMTSYRRQVNRRSPHKCPTVQITRTIMVLLIPLAVNGYSMDGRGSLYYIPRRQSNNIILFHAKLLDRLGVGTFQSPYCFEL